MMDATVAICLFTKENQWLNRYTIENLLDKTKIKGVSLAILNDIAGNIGISEAYNKLIKDSTPSEYICFFQVGTLVNQNWLEDLLSFHQNIDKSGVVSIRNLNNKTVLSPLLTKDESLCRVWLDKGDVVNSVSLIKRDIIEQIGGFDENLSMTGYEQQQFVHRVARAKHYNYCIPNQNATQIIPAWLKDINTKRKEGLLAYTENIEAMRKARNYSIFI